MPQFPRLKKGEVTPLSRYHENTKPESLPAGCGRRSEIANSYLAPVREHPGFKRKKAWLRGSLVKEALTYMVIFIFMAPSQQSDLLGHSSLSGHNSKQPERVSMNVWDLRQCQILRCKANSRGFLLKPSPGSFAL